MFSGGSVSDDIGPLACFQFVHNHGSDSLAPEFTPRVSLAPVDANPCCRPSNPSWHCARSERRDIRQVLLFRPFCHFSVWTRQTWPAVPPSALLFLLYPVRYHRLPLTK